MTDGVVAFMFGIGVAGWAYAKLARRTGAGNVKNAVLASGVILLVCFLFLYSLLKWVLHI